MFTNLDPGLVEGDSIAVGVDVEARYEASAPFFDVEA